MNQLPSANHSVRPSRKRINPSTIVEIRVGNQLKRYEPVAYQSRKPDQ